MFGQIVLEMMLESQQVFTPNVKVLGLMPFLFGVKCAHVNCPPPPLLYEQMKYRDRAAERREKYGIPEPPVPKKRKFTPPQPVV